MTANTLTRPAVRAMLPALAITPLLRYAIAVHTGPVGQPLRTTCGCGKPLWPNAVGPSGRCARCGQRLGAPAYAVEAAALLGAAGLIWSPHTGWVLAAYAWWTAAAIVLAFVKLAVMRLPLPVTAATTVGMFALFAAAGNAPALGRAGAAALVAAAGFAILVAASRGQFSWGEVAAMAPTAAALGWLRWSAVYPGLLLGFVTAGLTAIILLRIGRLAARMPLALSPFMLATAFAVVTIWP